MAVKGKTLIEKRGY